MPLDLPTSRLWSDCSARQFSAWQASGASKEMVAVLPVAAIEQHGPHLPVCVDTCLLDGVIEATIPRLAPDLPVLFLPTLALGKSNEHARYPGTLTLSAATLSALWMDVGASVAAAGVGKLLILNSHGGQMAMMEVVARELRIANDLIVVASNWFSLPLSEAVSGLFSADEHRFGIHAGDIETSMMLALRPQVVDMTEARAFDSAAARRAQTLPLIGSGAAKVAWQVQDLNPWGAAGDATLATAAKGQAVIDEVADRLAALLGEVHALQPDTLTNQTVWTQSGH